MHCYANAWPLRVFFVLSLLWGAPTLACGSFAPRPTPTPTLAPLVPANEPEVATPAVPPPIIEAATPTLPPPPTDTPAVPPPSGGIVGSKAQVVAPAGLNLREQPTSNSRLIKRLATGQTVTIVEGPAGAENFIWWKVDDGQGQVGWAAERDAETLWLQIAGSAAPAPNIGGTPLRRVDRAPVIGDRVEVTMPAGSQLKLRATPSTSGDVLANVDSGQRFIVDAGPQTANGYQWYQIRSEDGRLSGWAAAGNPQERWLTPLQ
jgi:uncharacterized protein YgiM (DUF1202 family)